MSDRRALVVTTRAAATARTTGATLRVDDVVALLRACGYDVVRTTPPGLRHERVDADLAVAVSYACAGTLRVLRRRAPRVWLDAGDSWLLVNGSGLRRGMPTYALRAGRDAWRLAVMAVRAEPELVTYISAADMRRDGGTVRARRRLVLPGSTAPGPVSASTLDERRIVLAGDWHYSPNRDGLTWFLRRVLPEIELRSPSADWHVVVYGAGAGAVGSSRVRCAGHAQDAHEMYRIGDVHAAPVRFGGGVKRKVLSPLLIGLPVVTTPTGAHGLRAHPRMDVRKDAAAFAAAVVERLHEQPCLLPAAAAEVVDRDDTVALRSWLRA